MYAGNLNNMKGNLIKFSGHVKKLKNEFKYIDSEEFKI